MKLRNLTQWSCLAGVILPMVFFVIGCGGSATDPTTVSNTTVQTGDTSTLRTQDGGDPEDSASPQTNDSTSPQTNDSTSPQTKDSTSPQTKDTTQPAQCTPEFSIGSTFNKGSQNVIGNQCNDSSAPTNCYTGYWVTIDKLGCFCTAPCETIDANCSSDGSFICQYAKGNSNAQICVRKNWNLCTGDPNEKKEKGESCTQNEQCKSGACLYDFTFEKYRCAKELRDLKDQCKKDSECSSAICEYQSQPKKNLCSTTCKTSGDCPSFWECKTGSDGNKYCYGDD